MAVKQAREESMWGYLMVAPTIIGLLVLNLYPFLNTLVLSFSKTKPFGLYELRGVQNYVKMFQSLEFWRANWNTIYFCILTVPVGIFLFNWVTDPNIIMITCAIIAIWSAVGYDAVLLLAGLQNISKSYYEAAREQILWGLTQADVVKISDEEVEFLWGTADTGEAASKLLEEYGVKLAMITLGPKGAYLANRTGAARVSCPPVKPVDTTGAGNIFGGS